MFTHHIADSVANASDRAGNAQTDTCRQTLVLVLPWNLTHPGGVNQVVANLFDTCAQALGLRPVLLVKSWGDRTPRVANIEGRRTIHVRLRRPLGGAHQILSIATYLLALPGLLWRLGTLVAREHVRVINVHYPDLDALTWLLLRWFNKNIRLVLSFHGSDARQAARASPLDKLAWRWLLTHADAVVACSQALVPPLNDLGCPSARITVIPNGVAPDLIETFANCDSRFTLPPRYIAALATFEFNKGLDVLLRAFDLLARADSCLHLTIAGRIADQNVFQALLTLCDQLGVSDRVTFLPNLKHEDAIRVLARAEAFVLPSRVEAFGIVVLEAGVLGIPVVVTSACGVVQYMKSGADFLVVPPGDEAALAAALARLFADPTEARRMAQRLRLRVLKEFTWSRIATQYAPVFGVPPACSALTRVPGQTNVPRP